jgi:hypothetical protein
MKGMKMKNNISIKTVNVSAYELRYPPYTDNLGFPPLQLEYILVVNGEEIPISKDMAFGIAGALDEYREQVRNEFEEKRFPYTFHKTFGAHEGTDK